MRCRVAFALLVMIGLTAEGSIRVQHVGMAAQDTIEIIVEAGHVIIGQQRPYRKEPQDAVKQQGHNQYLFREGKKLGVLVGADHDVLCPFDVFAGELLDADKIGQPATYRITSTTDPHYIQSNHPSAVYWKHKPIGIARTDDWKFKAPVRYHLYLKLPQALRENARYTVIFAGLPIPEQELVYDPTRLRSESVHVTQIGFHPADPAKKAFLSCWMGDGGGLEYPDELPFQLLNDGDQTVVYSGVCRLTKPKTATDEDAYKRNFTLANVYEMDFSTLTRAGHYRVCVEGIGCSYPFPIGRDVWRNAFITSARGFFHQRSGIALGPPCTTFQRPRSFHPDDGVKIHASSTRLMDTRNGLSRSDPNNFRNLVAGKTSELVPNAWGGYMDAGDWDRRIQHLIASLYLLDVADLFPEFVQELSLNIPESENDLPDVIDEALFGLDCYRRLQTAEGGIRGGIESEEHPNLGETSWQESLAIMAYAPGSWSSYYYAGVAAKAAWVLQSLGKIDLASVYEKSALAAMDWAEDDYAQRRNRPKTYQAGGIEIERMDHHVDVRDKRNYAAAELFRLTGEERWHRLFQETTMLNDPNAQLYVWQSHEQREAAWVYLKTDPSKVDKKLREYCRQATLREADERLRTQARAGFRWTKNDWAPPTTTLSVSDVASVLRAHLLTKKEKYLRGVQLACQAGLGANPLNLCYTTGLGRKWPHNPLHLDSRHTGQPPPEGLTVFGPADPKAENDPFIRTVVAPFCYPEPAHWPIMEAYWDVFWYPIVCEFTVHHPMAQNAYAWGYLAGTRQ